MKCAKCGKEIADNSVFCEFCGSRIREEEKPMTQTSKIDQSRINVFIGQHSENFEPSDLDTIKKKLETMDESKFLIVSGQKYVEPNTILIIAIILGWERFWMDDIALGILKVLTGYGCLVWWIIDIFSAKSRAKKYNFNKFMKVVQ